MAKRKATEGEKKKMRARYYREQGKPMPPGPPRPLSREPFDPKDWKLKRLYGITLEQREWLIMSQDGKCAICRNELVEGKHTHVDHDPKTGIVRGILCGSCNRAIGLFKHNVLVIQSAMAYLSKFL